MTSKSKTNQLPFLDGLRGYAALWVLINHALQMAGTKVPLLSRGDWAVDVFIIMSGFLMAFHYYYREQSEPWELPQTWTVFWFRRFWRLAPLYYVLLAVAVMLSSYLGQCRLNIAEVFPETTTDMGRYSPTEPINLAMHVSFLFGAFPQFAFATPLPDWSIGLEAQFYAFFPFIMLAFRAIPYVWVTLGFYALSALAQRFTHFPMPSFLPLKLSLFTIGILIATAYIGEVNEKTKRTLIGLVVAIAIFSGHDTNDRLLLLGVTTLLMSILFWKKSGVISQITQSCASFLSNRLAKSLGDLSYSIYLVHLLIMLPISSWLIQFPTFLNLPGLVRGTLIAGLTLIPTYIIATLLLKLIEKPGVSFGKQLVKKLQKAQPA